MPRKKQEDAPEITKRRVTMVNYVVIPPASAGDEPTVQKHEAVDYVRPDFLEQYVTDARKNWAQVTVSDEPDAGPGGYEGETTIPAHLSSNGGDN